ncbi:MAG: TRAP transporter small permease subunit [Pseudomonadota bacterium]
MPLGTVFRRVVEAWALLGGLLLLAVVALTAVNAAGFTADVLVSTLGADVSGLPGYEDAVTMFVGVAALAMFPYCQLHGGHAVVDVLMQHAPPWASRGVAVISAALTAALALALAAMLAWGAAEMRDDGTETPVLGWPVWVFLPPAVLSCLLWAGAAVAAVAGEGEQSDGA